MEMRIWIDGSDDKRQLVVLTDESVYAEHYDADKLALAQRELAAGKSPATLFGKDADHVPLRTLSRVEIDDNDARIAFAFRDGDKDKHESITFDDAAKRNELFAALGTQLHGRLQQGADAVTPARAVVAPLGWLTFFGVATWSLVHAAIAVRAAGDIEIEGRKRGLKMLLVWLLDVLGPIGVGIVGGLLCLLTVWVLVSRWRAPPRLQVLQEKPFRPPGLFATGFKYALLFVVWGFIALVMSR